MTREEQESIIKELNKTDYLPDEIEEERLIIESYDCVPSLRVAEIKERQIKRTVDDILYMKLLINELEQIGSYEAKECVKTIRFKSDILCDIDNEEVATDVSTLTKKLMSAPQMVVPLIVDEITAYIKKLL